MRFFRGGNVHAQRCGGMRLGEGERGGIRCRGEGEEQTKEKGEKKTTSKTKFQISLLLSFFFFLSVFALSAMASVFAFPVVR